MKNQFVFFSVIAALIVGGISFYGGTVYAKSKSDSVRVGANARFGGAAGGAMMGAGRMTGAGQGRSGAGLLNGQIVSKDANSLTIQVSEPMGNTATGKTATGNAGSRIVFFSASTTVSKMTQGSTDDLAQGTGIMVIGQTNADGSVTAQSIQIRPEGKTAGR